MLQGFRQSQHGYASAVVGKVRREKLSAKLMSLIKYRRMNYDNCNNNICSCKKEKYYIREVYGAWMMKAQVG